MVVGNAAGGICNSTSKVLPAPSLDSIRAFPPWARRMVRQIARLRPSPFLKAGALLEKLGSSGI